MQDDKVMVRPSTNVLGLRDGGVEPPSRLSPFAPTLTTLLSSARDRFSPYEEP